ncbi:glycosyl hydrolase family 43 protein [Drepanopeziza brunnea f. sp. 'multigermtubi' MB_m1]|uniref:Glycosyl hydrolase family 43 protein n=2 Tax=Drepanopeziza brunnea f. sp. 'multigermtubi' TaxID=698441 RepID=K1WFH7_MARBU|nr:glycosyl hydrolase family 43 protein [Drepanopeziza brunnea f. sp. 'multigermtubi' MB_m1]EKD16180.1 glycosyl hydrolase family 43 protein [Drepanopeziza brunnea f. sp. 'multigermtubi' MB_m1]
MLGLTLLAAALVPSVYSQATFDNPALYADFADNDISTGPDGGYYFSASNMHYSPGAPILRSDDLLNWKLIGHSVPTLATFGSKYEMTGNLAYTRGTWASTMRYRPSNGRWYWYGCTDFTNSWVFTASSPEGPWDNGKKISGTCFYDCGLLVDDDDTMYIVYGKNDVNVATMSKDGMSISKTTPAFALPQDGLQYIEGNRMYKRKGIYYILDNDPNTRTTMIWKSDKPTGPWVRKNLGVNVKGPLPPFTVPHQGSLVETPGDHWFFMSFQWIFPAGRIPVLAPISWGSDGYPILKTESGNKWGLTYPEPISPQVFTPSWQRNDTFSGSSLDVHWEWNHAPDPSGFSVKNGVTLRTVTVTKDLFKARNTLTHRTFGPRSVATITLDISKMADGDEAGLASFRDWTATIGLVRTGGTFRIQNIQGMTQDPTKSWATLDTGNTIATATLPGDTTTVYLRGTMILGGDSSKECSFEYSLDGQSFTALGDGYTMNSDWRYFQGQRWAIYSFATKALGGSVTLKKFEMSG